MITTHSTLIFSFNSVNERGYLRSIGSSLTILIISIDSLINISFSILIVDMKINIIGSGFAGLSAALFLSRDRSNSITLYDKFNEVQTIGAGILMQSSSMEVLKRLGLYKSFIENGEKVYCLEGINHRGRQHRIKIMHPIVLVLEYIVQCYLKHSMKNVNYSPTSNFN